MPSSLLAQWSEKEPGVLWLMRTAPRPAGRVLDVGPGCGKGAVLVREYVPSATSVWAVEAHPAYVVEHRLRDLYDTVRVGPFEALPKGWLEQFDTVLMVDVIEHIEKAAALRALDRCRGQVVICTPIMFAEAWEPGLPETEHHISHWVAEDFEATGHPIEQIIQARGGWLVRLGPKGA